jgi:hypothetical protein
VSGSRFEILGLARPLSDAPTGRIIGKKSGRLELTGIKADIPCTSGLRTSAFEQILPADQRGSPQKPHVRSVLGVRSSTPSIGMLPAIVKPWVLRLLAGNLLINA